jgi:hypothetical protein
MVIASWCKGSTSGFGPASLGSNPGGVTKNQNEKQTVIGVLSSDFFVL